MNSNNHYIKSIKYLVNKIVSIEGDILELGTYKGNNAIIFADILKKEKINKKYIGIDTFNGYVDSQIEESKEKVSKENRDALKKIQKNKRWLTTLEDVNKKIEKLKLSKWVELHKGDIIKTLPKIEKKISLLYVDCNVYSPSFFGMEWVYHCMEEGGIICIDEHRKGGETQALKDFATKYGQNIINTNNVYPNGPPKYIILKK